MIINKSYYLIYTKTQRSLFFAQSLQMFKAKLGETLSNLA